MALRGRIALCRKGLVVWLHAFSVALHDLATVPPYGHPARDPQLS
jgi:hypothetical protein